MAITRIEPYIVNSSANFTFAGVNVTANFNVTGVSDLGNVGNVRITGGIANYVLSTDGSGNLSWVAQTGGGGGGGASISNGNSNVNIATANGNVTVSVSGNSNVATFTGTGVNVAGTLNVTSNLQAANASLGNLATANFFSGVLTTAAQPNITSVGALGGLIVTGVTNLGSIGNVIITGGSNGQVLTTNGSGNLSWTSISTSSISNGNSNVNIPAANGNVTVSVTGNANVLVVTGTGANISGNLDVTGNISANGFTTSGSAGNISGANVITANTFIGVLANGNSNVSIPAANGNVNISAVGNANVLVVTGTGINVAGTGTFTGNVTAGNFIGNITGANTITGNVFVGVFANGNSNMAIPTANSNINLSVAGNSNILVVTGTGVNVAGTSNTTGNIVGGGNLNIAGNAVIGGNLTVDGNLIYVNVTDLSVEDPIIQLQTGPNGAAPISNSGKDVGVALNYYDTAAKIAFMGWDVSNAEIAFGANVGISSEVVSFTQLANIRAGNAQLGNLVTANFVSGVLTTASQPNITSVGTLGSLTVSGISNLGNVGNVKITGGTANYVLKTDGNGNLSWTAQTGGSGTVTVQESDNVGGNITNTISSVTTFNFDKDTGIFVTDLGNGNALISVTGGGSGSAGNVIVDTFTGNGSQTVFTLSTTPTSEDYILVNIDGVLQLHDAYTLAGNSLTLSSAPVNSAAIEVQTWNMGAGGGGGSGSNASFTVSSFTGDGTTANFAISNGATVNNTLVTLNGVLQTPTTDYTISGNTLTFGTAPSSGQTITFRELSGSGGGGSSGASNARVTGYSLVFGG